MTGSDRPVIEVEGLTRSFRHRRKPPEGAGFVRRLFPGVEHAVAIDGLSFTVGAGEFIGYVGPNGCGKSTTIKCLTGVLVPSSGRVRCLGHVPWEERLEYTAKIGVIFGQKSLLFWDLPVRDALRVYQQIYGIGSAEVNARLDEFDAVFGIGKLLDRKVFTLSLGERMRCEIVASLLHRPRLLFLDEPTIGLDADAKDAVRQLLQRLHRHEGATIVLTTHQMEDIETLCTRLLVLGSGRMLFDGTPAELRRRYLSVKRLRVTFSEVRDRAALEAALRDVTVLESGFDFYHLESPASVSISALTSRLLEGLAVLDLEMRDPDLDHVMRAVYAEGRAER